MLGVDVHTHTALLEAWRGCSRAERRAAPRAAPRRRLAPAATAFGRAIQARSSIVGPHPHPPCFAWSPLPVPGRDGAPDRPRRIPPSDNVLAAKRGRSSANRGRYRSATMLDMDRGLHPSPERGGGTTRRVVGGVRCPPGEGQPPATRRLMSARIETIERFRCSEGQTDRNFAQVELGWSSAGFAAENVADGMERHHLSPAGRGRAEGAGEGAPGTSGRGGTPSPGDLASLGSDLSPPGRGKGALCPDGAAGTRGASSADLGAESPADGMERHHLSPAGRGRAEGAGEGAPGTSGRGGTPSPGDLASLSSGPRSSRGRALSPPGRGEGAASLDGSAGTRGVSSADFGAENPADGMEGHHLSPVGRGRAEGAGEGTPGTSGRGGTPSPGDLASLGSDPRSSRGRALSPEVAEAGGSDRTMRRAGGGGPRAAAGGGGGLAPGGGGCPTPPPPTAYSLLPAPQ